MIISSYEHFAFPAIAEVAVRKETPRGGDSMETEIAFDIKFYPMLSAVSIEQPCKYFPLLHAQLKSRYIM